MKFVSAMGAPPSLAAWLQRGRRRTIVPAGSRRSRTAGGPLRGGDEFEQVDFGRAAEADGRRDRAEAARDEDLALVVADEAAQIFLAVGRWHYRRADQRKNHLAAVRVAAH